MGKRWEAFNNLPPWRMASIVVGLTYLAVVIPLDVAGVTDVFNVPPEDENERAAWTVDKYATGEEGEVLTIPSDEDVFYSRARRVLFAGLAGVLILIGISGLGKGKK